MYALVSMTHLHVSQDYHFNVRFHQVDGPSNTLQGPSTPVDFAADVTVSVAPKLPVAETPFNAADGEVLCQV